jgi:hypothetical protein
MERVGLGLPTRYVLLLFCMFALRKDERKLQYSRSNILGYDQKVDSDCTGLSGGFRGIGCGFKK